MSKREKIQKYLRFTRIKRACTARIISVFITISVGWFLTGDFKLGLSLGAIDTVIKLFIYYGHETIWEQKMTRDIKKIKNSYRKR
jgi:uncharacterized membrane protein